MNTREQALKMVEESRQAALQLLERLDELQRQIENGEKISFFPKPQTLSLSVSPHSFKGQKPMEITFADGKTMPLTTWKAVAIAILKDCNADTQRHNRMLELCGKVAGRQRRILSHNPLEMDVPLKIDDDIYFEGKFDTEYLIKMMTERVFPYVGYDYSGIRVTLKAEDFVLEPLPQDDSTIIDDAEDEDEMSTPQMIM